MGHAQEQGLSAGAVRIDASTGVCERAEFFGAGNEPIFGFRHAPPGAIGGVVICPSICADFVANYRREVVTARALASRGIAVQRFHYRGTGSSGGDAASVTFDALRDDAVLAARRLVEEERVERIAFLGTRCGALVAAAAAQEFPYAPIVLWEPTLEANRYFREGFRAKMIYGLKRGEKGLSPQQPLADLEANGLIDLLGYELHRGLYESAKDVTLLPLVGSSAAPMLLVQFSQAGEQNDLRPEYREAVSVLRTRGFDVDTTAVATSGTWWFPGESLETPDSLSRSTADWLVRQLTPAPANGRTRRS